MLKSLIILIKQINYPVMMTDIEKNALVQQYEPLINKITKQYSDKVKASWEDLKSMAYEGFAIAINTYDSARSSMTFAQFAGFAIRNNILTSLNNELRTVKLSAYAQKKAVEKGNAVFNSVSIEANWDSDSERTGGPKQKDMLNIRQEEKFSDGDIFETLYSIRIGPDSAENGQRSHCAHEGEGPCVDHGVLAFFGDLDAAGRHFYLAFGSHHARRHVVLVFFIHGKALETKGMSPCGKKA